MLPTRDSDSPEDESPLHDRRGGNLRRGLDELPVEARDLAMAAQIRGRFDVTPGTVLGEPVLRTNDLVFHSGGDLTIGDQKSPFVVVWAERVHFQDGRAPSQISVARLPSPNGRPGKEGARGTDGAYWGSSGGPGGPGGHGGPGDAGPEVPTLVFVAGEISSSSGVPPFVVDSRGVEGGDGGNGGAGGRGGAGHVGLPGYEESEGPIKT